LEKSSGGSQPKIAPAEIELVLVVGDSVMHGLSTKNPLDTHWDQMKPLFETQAKYLKQKFPKATILMTIGNNDVILYYQAPSDGAMK
jgi:hypothetical protein